MNKKQIKMLNKKADKILGNTNLHFFSIFGGLSNDPLGFDKPHRNVTDAEGGILSSKGLPIPICFALDREKEFLELLAS